MHTRRAFLALAALPAVAWLLAACGGGSAEPSPAPAPGPAPEPPAPAEPTDPAPSPDTEVVAVAFSDVERAAAPASEATAAVASVNALAGSLYSALARDNGNMVFSPASILLCLAMVRAGAAGRTATEMDGVLAIDDPEAIHRSVNALSRALESRNGTFDTGEEPGEVDVSIANSIWAQQGVEWQEAFLELLAREYGAGVRLADFEADAEIARVAINQWVSDETSALIPELLTPGMVTEMTRMVLVNAIYLKADWAAPFEQESTRPAPFTRLDGSAVDTDFMAQSGLMPYSRGGGWQAVELPYAGEELAMLVVLPDEGALADAEAALATGLLDDAAGALEETDVVLFLPKFDLGTRAELSDILSALGMATAFTSAADFSGMTTEEPLQIGFVIHEARIIVDEQGTEAAAATAAGIEATAAPTEKPEPVVLRVDRPFVYALRDRETRAVLFLGRVTDPTA